MNEPVNLSGPEMARFSQILANPEEALDLGLILGQRRALAAVGGRCSAAHAQILRRIRNEKLYRPLAQSWRAFCAAHLTLSRRHADRLIGLLTRFGPVYFELSELIGLSAQQYLAIEPAVREDRLLVDGEAISLVPENAPRIREAVGQLLTQSRPARRRHLPPKSVGARVADLTRRGRSIANELVGLYDSSSSPRDRELILEAATELRLILMQPGID